MALTGESAGDRWQEKPISPSGTFWSHAPNDENAISWPGEPTLQTTHEKTQGQRHRSRGVRAEVRTEAEAISKQPAMGETSQHVKVNQMKHRSH